MTGLAACDKLVFLSWTLIAQTTSPWVHNTGVALFVLAHLRHSELLLLCLPLIPFQHHPIVQHLEWLAAIAVTLFVLEEPKHYVVL